METIIRGLKGDRIFFTSDTHFNHSSIIRHCNRPFADVEQMNKVLIENWNSVIGRMIEYSTWGISPLAAQHCGIRFWTNWTAKST